MAIQFLVIPYRVNPSMVGGEAVDFITAPKSTQLDVLLSAGWVVQGCASDGRRLIYTLHKSNLVTKRGKVAKVRHW